MSDSRIVVWFSCGAASAVAAKLTIEKYGHAQVHVVYCDLLENENPDNRRFLLDVEKWIEHPVEFIRSDKYLTIEQVFEKQRYMSGIGGARCTREMKREPRLEYQEYHDTHIFGLTADEQKRIQRFKGNNLNLKLEWILSDQGMTKFLCKKRLLAAGIALPAMYSLGFDHNNCLGCVKSQSPAYWNLTRKHFPEVFQRRCKQSRELKVRLVKLSGKRIFLDELPSDSQESLLEDIECGPICVRG